MTKKKILIADDSAEFVKLLAARLSHDGFEVTTAASGMEAIEKVEAEKPDIVLLDWNMPAGSGDSVMEYFKATGLINETRVVVLTGMREPWVEESAKTSGAIDVLYKGLDHKDLLASIKSALATKQGRRGRG
jgi:CheY-like chemotaxis protein